MSSFSKQHLIFMPENGKGNIKLTMDLKIQDKHVRDSCGTCRSRKQHWFVNMQSTEVHQSILKQQRESLKMWNETMDEISKGNVFRKKSNNNLGDTVICLDDNDDNEIEEITKHTVLPNLSPIPNINVGSKTPVPSKTSTSLINKTPQSPSPVVNLAAPSNTFAISPQIPTKDDLLVLGWSKLNPTILNSLIYNSKPLSDDHVFWVDQRKYSTTQDRNQLLKLKQMFSRAQRSANPAFLKQLKIEWKKKEEIFVAKYIEKVELEENLSICVPMNFEERHAIYNPFKTTELFHLKSCIEQQNAIKNLKLLRSKLVAMEQIKNKYSPLVANELYHKENIYRKKYLTPKILQSTPELHNEKKMEESCHTEEPDKKKKKSKIKRQKLNVKRKQKKAQFLLKKLKNSIKTKDSLINENSKAAKSSTHTVRINEIITPIPREVENVTSLNGQKDSPDCPNFYSESTNVFSTSPRSAESINVQVTPSCTRELSIPQISLKQSKFRPYKSVLEFPVV